MEFVGQPSPSGACNLLGVPGLSTLDLDDDEGDIVIGIRPKSSPLPRRKTSVSDDDSDPEPPLSGSRRVSFADANGLSLVQVKEFDTWDIPKLPGYESSEGEGNDTDEYFLTPLTFCRPLSTEELFTNVREQKVELETLELLQGTTILKGVIRVLNMSFNKAVYIRTTLDSWSSHFDLLAEYVPGSSDGLTDCFSFRLTLVPPFGEQGARVDFCLRYETPVGTFWSNNNNRNYILFCQHRQKDDKKTARKQSLSKKSCLKVPSQNFNISGNEDSSQDNNSTDVSSHGLETGIIPAMKTCNGQSETSEEEKQKLLMENRQNSSRRSRRKAARMARVKDYFAQKEGGASDTERDDTKMKAVADTNPGENHKDVQSLSESNQSEGSQFISERAELRSELLQDATSTAHDYIPNSESVKSESFNLADVDTLPGGESASELQDKLVHTVIESSPAELPNINAVVTKAKESSQNENMTDTHTNSIAAVSSESLVSQTGCFTFGTVVAPLYQQVSGRVGSESQDIADCGNPVWAKLNIRDMNPHTESRQNDCSDATGATNVNRTVEGGHNNSQESTPKSLISPQNRLIQEENTGVTVNGVLDCAETLEIDEKQLVCASQDPKLPLVDTLGLPQTRNIMAKADLLESQVSQESIDQGEVLKEQETQDLESQITAERPQLLLIEHTYTQTKANQHETNEAKMALPSSIASVQSCQTVSEDVVKETEQQTYGRGENNDNKELSNSILKTDISVKEDELFDVKQEFNSNHIDALDTEETETNLVPCAFVEGEDFATIDASLETHRERVNIKEDNEETCCSTGHEIKSSGETKEHDEVDITVTEALINMEENHEDIMSVGQGEKCPVIEAAVDIEFTEFTRLKNWEAMVEEEENNIIGEEEGHTEHIKTKEDVRKHEDNEETTEEFMENITSQEVKEIEEAKSEDNQSKKHVNTESLKVEKETIDVNIELDYLQITKTEIMAKNKELVEDIEVQITVKNKGSGSKKLLEEFKKVFPEGTNLQEQEKDGNDTMEIDINDEAEAGGRSEDQTGPEEATEVQEGLDYKEEMVAVERDQSLNANVCITLDKDSGEGREEQSLEVLRKMLEADYLSAVVNNGQEGISGRVTDKEDNGERQNQTEICLREEVGEEEEEEEKEEQEGQSEGEGVKEEEEEEELRINTSITQDWSRAESDFGDACLLTDEPENDQASGDSASAESDSDDEVELYMHCLRAVSTGAQAHKDRSNDAGFTVSKRPSISKSKLLSTPMPSISESLDEEQQLSSLQENHEDAPTAAAALTASSGQESVNQNILWWKDTFSCSNISKTLLYTTLLVVFLVVAYHYDFLACFGLYMISVVWLYCQGQRQPAKNNNRIG